MTLTLPLNKIDYIFNSIPWCIRENHFVENENWSKSSPWSQTAALLTRKGKKKKDAFLQNSVSCDILGAKAPWNSSRADTSIEKPESGAGYAQETQLAPTGHLQLACNLHTFSSLPMIWLAASLPSVPIWAWRYSSWVPYAAQCRWKGIFQGVNGS